MQLTGLGREDGAMSEKSVCGSGNIPSWEFLQVNKAAVPKINLVKAPKNSG